MVARKTGSGLRPYVWSIALHGLIAAIAVGAWQFTRSPAPPQTLAIEATVVDAKNLPAAPQTRERPAKPEPAPPPQAPAPEPKVDRAAEEAERQEREAELVAERERQERQERERQEQELQRVEQQRLAAEEAAKKAAEEKRIADEQAAAKKAADAKRAAEEKRAADEARVRSQREAELRRSLEAEERASAMRTSGVANQWYAQIKARIERAWIRPPSARAGVSCDVSVTQVPGGEVVSVRVDSCTGGDDALRASVEAAVYRASPLPPPPDPSLFERNLQLVFRPND